METAEARQAAVQCFNEFTMKLNALLDSFRNPDGTIPLYKLTAIQGVLLFSAGFHEAIIKGNAEAARQVQNDTCPLCTPIPRLGIDQIYAVYTKGFNEGIAEADSHREELLAIMIKAKAEGAI